MFTDFIFQAYSIAAVLLILLYFLNSKLAGFYCKVVRAANRILWMFLFFIFVMLGLSFLLISVQFISTGTYGFFLDLGPELLLSLLALVFIFVALIVGSYKKRPLTAMFVCALVINFSTIPVGRYELVKSTIYTLIFLVLIVGLIVYLKMVSKDIQKEENQMPDRI